MNRFNDHKDFLVNKTPPMTRTDLTQRIRHALQNLAPRNLQSSFLLEGNPLEISWLPEVECLPGVPLIKALKFLSIWQNHSSEEITSLITMGGAYSNHVLALSYLSRYLSVPGRAFVRGEPVSNSVLQTCQENGMALRFVSRTSYRNLRSSGFQLNCIRKELDFTDENPLLIPEGGTNSEGVWGCQSLGLHLSQKWTHIACPCGTGGLMAGLIRSLLPHQTILGFSMLKGGGFLENSVRSFLPPHGPLPSWRIYTEYHQGGIGKWTPGYREFLQTQVWIPPQLINPHYLGKVLYAVVDLARQKAFPPGCRILLIG